MELDQAAPALKLLANQLSGVQACEEGGAFRLGALPPFDRVWVQVRRRWQWPRDRPASLARSSAASLPPLRSAARLPLPPVVPPRTCRRSSSSAAPPTRTNPQGTVQRKVAGSLKLDDGTGVFDCTVGGAAPGVEADTVVPGAFVLLIGKLQCKREGGGNRFNIKALKVCLCCCDGTRCGRRGCWHVGAATWVLRWVAALPLHPPAPPFLPPLLHRSSST